MQEDETDQADDMKGLRIPWIDAFVAKFPPNTILKVPLYFIDEFNTQCLQRSVKEFSLALNLILDGDIHEYVTSAAHKSQIEKDAETLYCLIHNRFMKTPQGLDMFLEREKSLDPDLGFGFGYCMNYECINSQPDGSCLYPVGLSDKPNVSPLCVYCPACKDIYRPFIRTRALIRIDGAYFGPSFPHLVRLHKKHIHRPSSIIAFEPTSAPDAPQATTTSEQAEESTDVSQLVSPGELQTLYSANSTITSAKVTKLSTEISALLKRSVFGFSVSTNT